MNYKVPLCYYNVAQTEVRNYVIFVSQGGRRFSEGTSADHEIQRTLMEVGGISYYRVTTMRKCVMSPITCDFFDNKLFHQRFSINGFGE